eukprot:6486900-Amphidinium_carterae.2
MNVQYPFVIPEVNAIGSARARASVEKSAARVEHAREQQTELLRRYTAKTKRASKKMGGELDMDRAQRSSNRTLLYVLESQLAAIDLNLSMFVPENRTCHGSRPHRVSVDSATHVATWKNEKGEHCQLVCTDEVLRGLRVWHITSDQGPKNWACLAHMASSVGVRMSYSIDIAHRIHNDYNLGISSSHLRAIKTEWKLVLCVRSGPFRSQANHQLLVEGARLMNELGASKQPLWGHHYERVCAERNLTSGSTYGEPEHSEEVFAMLTRQYNEASRNAKMVLF